MNFARKSVLASVGSHQRVTSAVRILLTNRHIRMSSQGIGEKPVEASIKLKLTDELQPVHLEILNESYMHNVPKGSETHFKVVVVSDKFASQPLIKRHRMVNSVLQHELSQGVHALSIVAKTPQQWESSDKAVDASPKCLGGGVR